MRGFAQALSASRVTVNAVLPGPTRTEGVEAMFKSMGQPALRPAHARQRIWPHHLHFIGIRRTNSDRDDSLRLHPKASGIRTGSRLDPA